MYKKSQLTIFLLASVVLAVLVIMSSFVREEISKSKEIRELRGNPISALQKYVQSCLEQVAYEGIHDVSLQGGYYNPPLASTAVLGIQIPHYWNINTKMMPQKERIEQEVDDYVEQKLPECVQDFSVFSEQGFTISSDKPIVHSIINDENVIVNLRYPVDVLKAESKFSLNEFSAAVTVPLAQAYGYATMILDEQQKTPNLMPIGYIAILAKEKGFTFEIIHLDSEAVIMSLIFKTPNKKDYLFSFSLKYDWENEREVS